MANKTQAERGLPINVDVERFILGAIMMDNAHLDKIELAPEDFGLAAHTTIFKRVMELHEEAEAIDRTTIANSLMQRGELNQVGGLTYLVSLDDGMPQIPDIAAYARIVKEASCQRQILFACQNAMNQVMARDATSQEILEWFTKRLTELEISSGKKSSSFNPEQIIMEAGGATAFMEGAIDPGISFGFPQFDEDLIGLQRGCQYIIAGRTSSGKSALSGNIAVSLAKRGEAVEIFSLEMSKEIYLARILCAEAQVPLKAYIRRDMNSWQKEAMHHALMDVATLPIYIDDNPSMTVSDIPTRVNRAVHEHHARVFVLDHIHRVSWMGDQLLKLNTEYAGITAASWACALSVRKHNISSLVLCQLNRPEDKKKESAPPTLTSLRSTGALEMDATGVSMVHRPEMFDHNRPEIKGLAEVYHRKSRNGTTGVSTLAFKGAYTLFSDEGKPVVSPSEEE